MMIKNKLLINDRERTRILQRIHESRGGYGRGGKMKSREWVREGRKIKKQGVGMIWAEN